MFARARSLGDVVRLAVPGRHPVFVLADPADIHQVLQENHSNYRRTPFHDRLKIILGEGLATSEGELWRGQGASEPAFRAERIRRFVEVMGAAAAELATRWEAAADVGRYWTPRMKCPISRSRSSCAACSASSGPRGSPSLSGVSPRLRVSQCRSSLGVLGMHDAGPAL